ncbi:s-formylglutathione hydrolase [Moniliophthora roreri]|nr:s-formylglutathione hydrolase [Moniliophthora roreri]
MSQTSRCFRFRWPVSSKLHNNMVLSSVGDNIKIRWSIKNGFTTQNILVIRLDTFPHETPSQTPTQTCVTSPSRSTFISLPHFHLEDTLCWCSLSGMFPTDLWR